MNWLSSLNISSARFGAFLALMIVVFLPNYNIEKYGPSPAVPAFLLAVMGMWIVWRERMQVFAATAMRRWTVVFLLLFVPALISVPLSHHLRLSSSTVAVLALYFFCGVALVRVLRDDAEREWLAKWVSVVLLFWVADSAIQYFFGSDLFGIELAIQGRVIGPFSHNLNQSVSLLLLMPLMLWWLAPRSMAGALAAFLLASVTALLGGARTISLWLVFLATAIIIRLPNRRWKWGTLVAILIVLGGSMAISPAMQERLGRFKRISEATVNYKNVDRLLSMRLSLWDTGLNMVAERPFTGVGVGAFRSAYDSYSTNPDDYFRAGKAKLKPHHAHHLYVSMAAETGFPGLIALVVILVLCIRWYLAAAPPRRNQAWPYATGLFIFAFPINSQPFLYSQWLFPVMVLLLIGMLASLDESPERVRANQPVS